MRKVNFRYKPKYGIPKRWQEYIYCLGRLYYELPGVSAVIDEACASAGGEYADAVKKCVVGNLSPRRASIECYASERVIQYRLRRYYNDMYVKVREAVPHFCSAQPASKNDTITVLRRE